MGTGLRAAGVCDSIVSAFDSETISRPKNPEAHAVGDPLPRPPVKEVCPTPPSATQAVEVEVHKAGWRLRGLGEARLHQRREKS